MQTDMTVGSPFKMMFNFAVPVLIGNLFQQFYTMADTMIVGKFIGTKALAAVGATGTITFFILGLMMGITSGFAVLVSQKYGAGDMKRMRQAVVNGAILSFIIGAVVTACSMAGMKSLLSFMHTPEDIFADCYAYIMIICGGILASAAYNYLASILRALGNSKAPLYVLVLSAVLNIALDLIFILLFEMGVKGAAWATILSQGVSGIACFFYIRQCVPELKLGKEDLEFRKDIAFHQLGIGIPMGLQFSITAIGSMMVQSSLNLFGSFAVAAFSAAVKIENFFQMAYMAISSALATFNAQNIGAGKLDRVREGFRTANKIGITYAVVAGAFLAVFGKYLTYLFISDNIQQVLPMVQTYLLCAGLFYVPLYIVNAYRNGIQGMGYGFLPMCAGIMELIGRAVMAVWAAGKHQYVGVCLAGPMAWLVASAFLIFMYYYVMRDMQKKLERK